LALHKITTFGLSLAALAASGWLATASAQAPDASPAATPPSSDATAPATGDTSKPPAKPVHHHSHAMASHSSASKGDAAVDDLNAQSLDAAKAGKSFTPPTTTPTEGKSMAKPEGKTMAKPMHHHHHMPAKKPADAGAPADGGTPPAPAPDSTPK
jgi:hypothetical protein